MRNCVKVAQTTLTRFVRVRILLPQPDKKTECIVVLCFFTHRSVENFLFIWYTKLVKQNIKEK